MLTINLLPVREARRKAGLRQYFMQLLLVMIIVGGGVGLFHSRLMEKSQRTQGRVTQMQSDIEQFAPQVAQVAAFKQRKSELEKKIDVIDGLDKARSGPVRIMDELASRTPDRLWLTRISTRGDTIALEGQSLDNELVALFLRSLGESDYFAGVDLGAAKLGEEDGLKLVHFDIDAKLVSPALVRKKQQVGSSTAAPAKS
ncbi:MAG: PilN domain-containing protein [Deltaproteobacteria bacterium]|nr:PilN domain-containing protein [Deltaproteobacteria bacterium]MBW2362796.1 PilN domain-containing protein [Deltaproteobacteria bacterium]